MEHLINVRFESLIVELDNNECQLLQKINKFIRSHVRRSHNQKVTKKVILNIKDPRSTNRLSNSNKIGFISLEIYKYNSNHLFLRSENAEELVQKILNQIL